MFLFFVCVISNSHYLLIVVIKNFYYLLALAIRNFHYFLVLAIRNSNYLLVLAIRDFYDLFSLLFIWIALACLPQVETMHSTTRVSRLLGYRTHISNLNLILLQQIECYNYSRLRACQVYSVCHVKIINLYYYLQN